jgi:hypothetical protein
MKSTALIKDIGSDVCGLELFVMDGKVEICGKPGSLWGLVDLPGWENSQIVACTEHYHVLYDDPDVRVTSDVPFRMEGECTCDP